MTAMRNSLAHSSPPNGDGPALTPPQELAEVAACRAELRNTPLQQWAAEAGWREAADVDYQVAVPPELPSPRAQLTWEALSPATSPANSRPTADSPSRTTSNSDNGGTSSVDETLNASADSVSPGSSTAAAPSPAAAAGAAVGAAAAAPAPASAAGAAVGVAAAHGGAAAGAAAGGGGVAGAAPEDSAALLCSEGWQRAAMARAATSAYVGRAVKRNVTSLARIEAGVDAVCRGATRGRRFLVFAYSLEQLSNTRSHLVEAARFAQATNRTLVLPKGSRSRLSLARDLPLCDYFDLSRLGAHWISPEFFLHLARAAVNPPFAAAAAKASPSVAFVHLQTSQVWRMTFNQGPLVDMLSELVVYGMGHAPSRRNTVDVNMPVNSSVLFQQVHQWRNRDVLVWVKTTYDRVDFHLSTDDISFKMLPYSQTWHAMAHRAMARLPPRYIAVHYRSEFIAFNLAHKLVVRGFKMEAGVLEGLMAGCMEAARDLINGMKRRHNISAVFIAADVPFDGKAGSVVRSDSWNETTWKFQGAEKERALQAPREKLRWLREQVAGTVMVDELMPSVNRYDPGLCTLV
ncbi:unnamed protein product, partial [Closterium sp. Naga37s-1]